MNPTFLDADGHILEPTDLWVKNIEQKFKDRSIRLKRDGEGFEYWSFGGDKDLFFDKGTSANVATIGKSAAWRKEHIFDKHDVGWEEGLTMNRAAWDPAARIRLMDEEGIDASILYPTMALNLGRVTDPDLAAAYCRVYNDWIVDFCREDPHRLLPALTMPWASPAATVEELKRNADIGPRAVQLPSAPPCDITYGKTHWDPVWAECQEQDLPVSLHVGAGGRGVGSLHYPEKKLPDWWGFVTGAVDVVMSFVSFFEGGVFERFPRLRLVVLESGCGWMPWIVERMDEKYEVLGFTTPLERRPSEHFRERCWISMDPDDELAVDTIKRLGADRVIWPTTIPTPTRPSTRCRTEEDPRWAPGGRPAEDHGRERQGDLRIGVTRRCFSPLISRGCQPGVIVRQTRARPGLECAHQSGLNRVLNRLDVLHSYPTRQYGNELAVFVPEEVLDQFGRGLGLWISLTSMLDPGIPTPGL